VKTLLLDTGALIALERGDGRMRALCREALSGNHKFVVPTGVVGQAWRGAARQHAVHALLDDAHTTIVTLDRPLAEAAGVLCGRTRTSDVIDATVVLLAKREKADVVTSDPADIARLDPTLVIHEI
jgi:predicted nucleic acid-binding protein